MGRLDAYLSACQLGITLASLGLGWIGEPAFAGLLTPLLRPLGVESPHLIEGISLIFAFSCISFLHIVIGELAPKSLAIRQTERIALWTATPLYGFLLGDVSGHLGAQLQLERGAAHRRPGVESCWRHALFD